MPHNESVFAMAGYSSSVTPVPKVDFCFIVEDYICRLIINVKSELKPIKDLLPIVLPSSPAIANTFVSGWRVILLVVEFLLGCQASTMDVCDATYDGNLSKLMQGLQFLFRFVLSIGKLGKYGELR